MFAASMTMSLSMNISMSSHFIVYLSKASCSLATEVSVCSVLKSCTHDYTACSAFPLHPLWDE